MRNPDVFIKEYVGSLEEDDLKFLFSRLSEKLSGDVAEAINFLDKTNEFAKWFYSAKSSDDLYDMLDKVFKFIEKEHNKRFQLA
jgi:predicted transcriptional regulator